MAISAAVRRTGSRDEIRQEGRVGGEEGALHAEIAQLLQEEPDSRHRAAIIDNIGILGLELGNDRGEVDVGRGDAGIGRDLAATALLEEFWRNTVATPLAERLLVVDDGSRLGSPSV